MYGARGPALPDSARARRRFIACIQDTRDRTFDRDGALVVALARRIHSESGLDVPIYASSYGFNLQAFFESCDVEDFLSGVTFVYQSLSERQAMEKGSPGFRHVHRQSVSRRKLSVSRR